MSHRFARDARSDAIEAERFAEHTGDLEAWSIAGDAWELAEDPEYACRLRRGKAWFRGP